MADIDEEFFAADLAAFEENFGSVDCGLGGPDAAEWRAWVEGADHGEGLDAEGLAGETGGVSSGDDGSLDASATDEFSGEGAEARGDLGGQWRGGEDVGWAGGGEQEWALTFGKK